ncbi:MAG: Ppx/GppA phosphatase [Polyangiaceae bacterium]|jgi:exopolyphosphatase/guanosine-5'-triphosphate,3'-diphosphate pyrophosphatase|nr:Ppx/GppA phosphatase [Polyangiaceae bacterium]
MNVAAVDIGTNSARLLITSSKGEELARPMRITRLGQGVDVTGRLAPEAVARTVSVLEGYGAECRRHGVSRLRVTATSAARDAENADDFFDAVERTLGARPELLSGEEEARLSFLGATSGLPAEDAPFFVVDIGGGSTELVLGSARPEQLVSLQLGCRRMSERHLHSDPPRAEELEQCQKDVEATLAAADGLDVRRARRVVGLAGTVTAISALQLGLERYDASRTHHSTLTLAQVEQSFHELSRAPLTERRKLLAEPERADVIVGGALVLLAVLRHFHLPELLVSEHDILDGLASSLL